VIDLLRDTDAVSNRTGVTALCGREAAIFVGIGLPEFEKSRMLAVISVTVTALIPS
jgi:hypothetical protein